MTLRALIFDVDGTLAETEEAHRRAFNETFAKWSLPWHWEREAYARLLKTTGGKERIRAFQAELGRDALSPDEIADLHMEKTARYAVLLDSGGLELRPGIARLIDEGRSAGLRIAVATTTNRPNVESLALCCWGRPASEIFDVIAAGDEVPHKKPAPDVYDLALRRLGLPANAAIAFEDSRNGLTSALGAGITTVITPSSYTADEDFTGAALVRPDLATTPLDEINRLIG